MPTTVMLVRWFGGWREVENAAGISNFGRREALLSLGAQQSIGEVDRIAGIELSSTFAKNREQMTVEHRPANLSEVPYIGYVPSDRVTAKNFDGTPILFPVISMAVTQDDDGVVTFVPSVGDIVYGITELQEGVFRTAPID